MLTASKGKLERVIYLYGAVVSVQLSRLRKSFRNPPRSRIKCCKHLGAALKSVVDEAEAVAAARRIGGRGCSPAGERHDSSTG